MSLSLRLHTLLEPANDAPDGDETFPAYDERGYIERRIGELRQVEAESLAVLQEPYSA